MFQIKLPQKGRECDRLDKCNSILNCININTILINVLIYKKIQIDIYHVIRKHLFKVNVEQISDTLICFAF